MPLCSYRYDRRNADIYVERGYPRRAMIVMLHEPRLSAIINGGPLDPLRYSARYDSSSYRARRVNHAELPINATLLLCTCVVKFRGIYIVAFYL